MRCCEVDSVSVDETVRVGAAFDNSKVLPMWFRWRNRYYKIKAVNYTWSTNKGSARLHHYAVTDGATIYELRFDTNTLEWTLSKIAAV
ncbi:MAG TPA: hypothetical protein PLU88_14725 [Armatimonadota bacterium]|nr:hypothetical protein [Armatimonadota bacterium]HOP79110.1 hypothetical protein [Armatimonadota bacterium]HPP76372.1 hypothetical protein [Armatimonadota bacterium]